MTTERIDWIRPSAMSSDMTLMRPPPELKTMDPGWPLTSTDLRRVPRSLPFCSSDRGGYDVSLMTPSLIFCPILARSPACLSQAPDFV